MSLEDFESHHTQKRPLHRLLNPASFYPRAQSRSSMAVNPHGPSLLRLASTPGPSATAPDTRSSFAIVIGSSPSQRLTNPVFGSTSTAKKQLGRPFKNPQVTPIQPITKKKGRPFKTPEAAAAAAAARGTSGDHSLKKRGRPFKYPQKPEEVEPVIPPEPKFVPFTCEWKNCPAELHNLDTLKAHLITVHLKKQPSGGPLVCLWRKCCREYEVMDLEKGTSSVVNKGEGAKFKTKQEWHNHVKEAHLDRVARYQGEGPKTEISFFEKPRPAVSYSWLLGGPEHQATPSVRNQPIEEGRAKENNAARFHKKRDGLYVVFEPVKNHAAYMKVDDDEHEGDEADRGIRKDDLKMTRRLGSRDSKTND